MNFIKALQSKEIKEKGIKTKFAFAGFVFALILLYLMLNCVRVGAVSATITGTSYKQDGTNFQNFSSKTLTSGDYSLTFIQGNGKNSEVAIKFTINDFPSTVDSFVVVESEHSDSDDGDLDRYTLVGTEWVPSNDVHASGIVGSATAHVDDPTKIDVVYRIRKGAFGLQFLKLFLYDHGLEDLPEGSNGVTELEVFYVISQPVNTLPDDVIASESCSSEEGIDEKICIQYDWDGDPQREPRPLELHVPKTIAYKFLIADEESALTDYIDKTKSTIYAINYFKEENGELSTVDSKDDANRSYLYVNFQKNGSDTTETFSALAETSEGAYMNYRVGTENAYVINELVNLKMQIDAKGTYFFYIVDIFGNVKEVNKSVDNVINRTLYTEIEKGNTVTPGTKGYNAEEKFTNKSVSVSLTMTVEVKFEYGQCLILGDITECAQITNLTSDQVKYIKYWRVDVKIVDGDDVDAFDGVDKDPITEEYASESYAYDNEFFYIYCLNGSCPSGATVQTWDSDENQQTSVTNAGFASFSSNTITMYLALSGRYRFYIQDIQGNNTWGEAGDLAAQEDRNPRVEIYGIDKSAPEITFEHDDVKTVGGKDLTLFDIETYEFYRGIELTKDGDGKFIYDGRMSGNPAAGTITTGIYYPINRDDGRTGDVLFTDLMALIRSHVRATEYVYYYTGTPLKDEFSDYSIYDRLEEDSYYVTQEYDNSRTATISKNTKHNSTGMLDSDDEFNFEIRYYHNNGTDRICAYLGTIDESYETKTELQCVNYYLDHGVDFIIEFGATDTVGNTRYEKVYVNVVDTTPAGFTPITKEGGAIDNTKTVKSSNIGTECRMEMGSIIGKTTVQDKTAILKCYNVILVDGEDTIYNFEDNVYDVSTNAGLSFKNRINSNDYVKVYIKSDIYDDEKDEYPWIDIENQQFIPNHTGYYDMKIEIHDNTRGADGTNVLTVLVSYYVDKKIVLVEPKAEDKFYGDSDATAADMFDYCVWINNTNDYDIGYFDNPYAYLDDFSIAYCSNYTAEQITTGKNTLFRENVNTSDFAGELTRLESVWYNQNLSTTLGAPSNTPIKDDNGVGIENNYVGLYRIILGTLNINITEDEEQDPDYVVKIHPTYRDATKYKGTTNDNLVSVNPFEDDLPYTQSNVDFTIKQVMLNVTANGGNKSYGATDTNYHKYNSDGEQTNPYLNGYTVDASGLKYNDDVSVVLGVLRREIGENVGVYYICNYRGPDTLDDALESTNNMYVDCEDNLNNGWEIVGADPDGNGGEYKHTKGIINGNANYIKSRALYIETNKEVRGKTLNTTTKTRDNNRANYVIVYTGNIYTINPIDLVVQAAPGQRREYNKTAVLDPNPWEIILYGLVDFARTEDDTFNGWTVDSAEYSAEPNQEDVETDDEHVSKWEANQSEERETWRLVHGGKTLIGLKTNETYTLLRSTEEDSVGGSAKLTREAGQTGGWYLYYGLGNDVYVGASEARTTISDMAVITNGNKNCTYATNGHTITEVSTDGEALCKNYNLVYNDYYTNEDGYTYETKLESHDEEDFIYKSNGEKCTVLDPGLPCPEEQQYNIQFEIYRREIIMEFNSAIERIVLEGTEADGNYYDIVYGKRYNYYYTNFFDIDFYDGKKYGGVNILPEDYLFICYQNETTRSNFTAGDASTGCTGDWRYGLTEGDTWSNIGLDFWMHKVVSANNSGYYGTEATDKAVPAGIYYIYSDISEEQKANYNFIYKGGTLTIKSRSVDIQITSYQKEYGESHYAKYGVGTSYGSFTSYNTLCMNDGLIITSNANLISGVTCGDHDASNTHHNIYGFYVSEGLDDLDTIANNFTGTPNRSKSTSLAADTNALQDDVGIYTITKGLIKTKNNNPFMTTNACAAIGDITDDDNLCAVVVDKYINNYVIDGETREYVFDMQLIEDIESTKTVIGTPTITNGYLYITPATLTITTTSSQTKMYGCAYNTFNTNSGIYTYSYDEGYSNCIETDGSYYDLGYSYSVSGDKDYTIANSDDGYDYENTIAYTVSGILGSNAFRPTVKKTGIKSHALNSFGTLYRVPTTEYATGLTNVTLSTYATNAQKSTGKTYQVQTVGNYILTLGNVDAAVNTGHATMKNTCDVNNMPVEGGTYACKNYHIDYYGTNTNPNTEDKVEYLSGESTPSEIYFTITTRKAYVYTDHDEKIYGDEDPNVKFLCGDYNKDGIVNESDNIGEVNGDVYYRFCSQEEVDLNIDNDASNDVEYEYGLTKYYTKTNSLAKYPWNGIEGRDDVQHDIIGGKLSRKGMPTGTDTWAAPKTDDIRGFYEYVYEDADFGGTVALNSYGSNNYTVNFYNSEGLAVNIDGETQNDDADADVIQFEIVLRQIQIAFVTFDKVYGEADNVEDYDILVCAPTDTFDFVNMKCIVNDATDPHGLSATHKAKYMVDGILKQEDFKKDFVVRFKRVLGENVSCENTVDIEVVLDGYFFGSTEEVTLEGTKYTKTLTCGEDDNGYEGYQTLAYIDQQTTGVPGYNYQVSYTIGQMNVTKRKILITPDANQGFEYGDYYGTLIPAIKFTDSLNIGNLNTRATYGLVNNTANSEGVCLKNIDYYNNGENAGTCFNINDRKDEYNSGNSMTTSAYDSSAVNASTGLANLNVKNFVFGDVYTSESSTRSALNRKNGTSSVERYNRNVGTYTIVLGDLQDKTGNYEISLTADVEYKITSATLTVTPEETSYTGTTQDTQYKIYGEQDKELTFTIKSSYKVKYSHYALYDSAIVKVCPATAVSDEECTNNAGLDRYNYNTATGQFVKIEGGTYIYLTADVTVTINGYAYNETDPDKDASNLDYGSNKAGEKVVQYENVNQAAIKDSQYYDIACKNQPTGVGCTYIDPDTQEQINPVLSYGDTSRILLGYLHVENYSQAAGVYEIVSGFKIALNEWNDRNYTLNFVEDVEFTIIPRPIGVQIQNIEKTYGQTTDVISCELVEGQTETCTVAGDILHADSENYLKYNFTIETFNDATRIANILGTNSSLYSQNSTFVNGLVTQANYSEYKVAETKNSNKLGVYVSRDEKNSNADTCLYSSDRYGFCEDVGTYYLRFYGYSNTIDSITKDNYKTQYKPTVIGYAGANSDVSTYYYNSYWGYNPNYFVIVVESDTVADVETDETSVKNVFIDNAPSSNRSAATGSSEKLLKSTGTLKINPKSVAMYVNTTYFGSNPEIYYIQQNTNPPSLPTINNEKDLKYDDFMNVGKQDAVYDYETYGNVIWGTSPKQVRKGDKLVGELAYCDKIISANAYYSLRDDGISSDYECTNLLYEDNKNSLNTHLEGYVPIVRSTSTLSIVSQSHTSASAAYENLNYTVQFYPGGLRIEEDDVKPVVQVNRPDVYIEANAIGEYLYECVSENKSTTYKDCELGGSKISIVGKTELTTGDPILDIFNELGTDTIIQVELPTIEECNAATGHACTASAYYQLIYGKGQDGFVDAGGIKAGVESTLVTPFTMEKNAYVKNAGPTNLKELIITLVRWFGVTAYDQGEERNNQLLDKKFDKYWYIAIEEEGTNGNFDISKVGKYTVHFYVMDNAGNVSDGNMYVNEEGTMSGKKAEDYTLQTTYSNVGTLHIIDTTKPVVGTLNLYSGKVRCDAINSDCSIEANWQVAENTYVPVNTLGRYDSSGNPSATGEYIYLGNGINDLTKVSMLKRYTLSESGTYVEDNAMGKYILIETGKNARALKHYSWTNSSVGVYLTITGGSDNSYTEYKFPDAISDDTQWNHYFSRDGGTTWFLYDRDSMNNDGYISGYLALDAEGSREILIKAVDTGVKIETATEETSTYYTKYYGNGNANNQSSTMTKYVYADTSVHDAWLETFEETYSGKPVSEIPEEQDSLRHEKVELVGWNVSDWSQNDTAMAEKIATLIYGTYAAIEGKVYTYYRDKQTAYLDRTKPVIEFGAGNGKNIYLYEYGCGLNSCKNGYTEHYAGAQDTYPTNNTSREIAAADYNKHNSIFINHNIFEQPEPGETSKYQGSYRYISTETLTTVANVGGLGSDMYAMKGSTAGVDIRNVYSEERRYIINAFNPSNAKTVYDLSSDIPTSSTSTEGEDSIYEIIPNAIAADYNQGDFTYTIIYSVIDKAGNESVYVARGVIFASLIPQIKVEVEEDEVEEIEENVYRLTVNQGADLNEFIDKLDIGASTGIADKITYLKQTVYHNGELIEENRRYKENIHESFNLMSPGVYEVVYSLSYVYEKNGEYETIDAEPVKLIINIEATPPTIEDINSLDYSSLLLMLMVTLGAVFICLVGFVSKKRN